MCGHYVHYPTGAITGILSRNLMPSFITSSNRTCKKKATLNRYGSYDCFKAIAHAYTHKHTTYCPCVMFTKLRHASKLYLHLRNKGRPPIGKCCIELNKSCTSSYLLVCILTTEPNANSVKRFEILMMMTMMTQGLPADASTSN